MELLLVKTLTGLTAADDPSRDELRHVKLGTVMRCELRRMRNAAHHRKFFALLSTVWAACGDWPSVDALLTDLKFRLRHTEDVLLVSTGEIVRIPKSISFANMDEAEFSEFYERALRELAEMAGGIDDGVLRETVLNQLAAA